MLMIDQRNILFYSKPVDMRKSFNSLCALIVEVLEANPADGTYFLFRDRQGKKIKILYYEMNCFTIWYRRLEKGRYIFQRNLQGKVIMSPEHFKWLLASDKYSDRTANTAHEIIHFY